MAQGRTTEQGVTSLEVIREIDGLQKAEEGTGRFILGREIERKVGILLRSNGKLKFTKILSKIGKAKPVDNIKTEYGEVDQYPLNITVTEAVTANHGHLIDVQLSQEDIRYAYRDEVISFKDIPSYKGTDAVPYKFLTGRIIEKKTDGKITVQCIDGKIENNLPVFADDIPADTVITRLSTAKKEWDISADAKNRFPINNYNYGQKTIYQLSESSWSKRINLNIDWTMADQFQLAMYDEEERRELQYLLGTRSIMIDPATGNEVYTCGGVLSFVNKYLDFNGALNSDSLNDAQKEAKLEELICLLFDNNSGSDTRTAFIGTQFYSALNKIQVVKKQLDGSKPPYEYFGMNFRSLTYNGFDLLLVRHPLLDFGGMGDFAICLDMENIEEHVFEPMEKIPLDLKKMGIADGTAFSIKRTACPVVKFPETHCVARL